MRNAKLTPSFNGMKSNRAEELRMDRSVFYLSWKTQTVMKWIEYKVCAADFRLIDSLSWS